MGEQIKWLIRLLWIIPILLVVIAIMALTSCSSNVTRLDENITWVEAKEAGVLMINCPGRKGHSIYSWNYPFEQKEVSILKKNRLKICSNIEAVYKEQKFGNRKHYILNFHDGLFEWLSAIMHEKSLRQISCRQ